MFENSVVPIVINKRENLRGSDNYRPITLATILSMLFESVVLLICETFFETCPLNFVLRRATV